jgi:hypothetical protein
MDEIDLNEHPQQFIVTLEKKGRTRGRFLTLYRPWSVRTFKLDQHTWFYYEKDTLKGSIDLLGAKAEKVSVEDAEGKLFALRVHLFGDSESVLVNAPNEITRELCMAFILKAAAEQDYWTPFRLTDVSWLTSIPRLKSKLGEAVELSDRDSNTSRTITATSSPYPSSRSADTGTCGSPSEPPHEDLNDESGDFDEIPLNSPRCQYALNGLPEISCYNKSHVDEEKLTCSTRMVLIFSNCLYVGSVSKDCEEPGTSVVVSRPLSAEGTGYAYLLNGDVYEGEFHRNAFHGRGVFSVESRAHGMKYDGEFDRGLYQGKGILMVPGQYMCEGNWFGGKMQGYGKVFYRSGYIYEGEYFNGNLHGIGSCSYPDKERHFVGEFVEGAQYFGILLEWTGDIYIGGFVKVVKKAAQQADYTAVVKTGCGRLITTDEHTKSLVTLDRIFPSYEEPNGVEITATKLEECHAGNDGHLSSSSGHHSNDAHDISADTWADVFTSFHAESLPRPTPEHLQLFEAKLSQLLADIRARYPNKELLNKFETKFNFATGTSQNDCTNLACFPLIDASVSGKCPSMCAQSFQTASPRVAVR